MRYVSKSFTENDLLNLKRQKATGIDNLPPGLLKDCAMYIATPLCYIINLSISTSTIPKTQKHAKVLPVFKSGDTSEPGNYRLISIQHENLFRFIFETQIHIQIQIRYFKSLPIVTSYLSTIHIKSFSTLRLIIQA